MITHYKFENNAIDTIFAFIIRLEKFIIVTQLFHSHKKKIIAYDYSKN